LRDAPVSTAAASILENLVDGLGGVVRTHVLQNGASRVVLGGALFDNPRLVARIVETLDVDSLFLLPEPGARSLPLGAATDQGGVAPHQVVGPGLGRSYSDEQCGLALRAAAVQPLVGVDAIEAAAARLVDGAAVARFQGRGGAGHWGGGARSVLVRADRPDAVAHTRSLLGRDPREEAGCVWDGETGGLLGSEGVPHMLGLGGVALKADAEFARAHPAVVAKDGRVLARRVHPTDEPELRRLLHLVRQKTGCGALAALPLGLDREPPAARPGDAVRAWRRSGVRALLLGPHLVDAAEGPL
ncbi:MAG: carbamoyltransferase C-terminal domain-containing protein, partial [Myxococcota bacterium]